MRWLHVSNQNNGDKYDIVKWKSSLTLMNKGGVFKIQSDMKKC